MEILEILSLQLMQLILLLKFQQYILEYFYVLEQFLHYDKAYLNIHQYLTNSTKIDNYASGQPAASAA